jgi:orc1/cdc6 family replication initiation protein
MFDKRSVIIKDGTKLSFDYVPEKLVHREEHMRRLEMLFRPVFEDGRSETAFLIGSVGTGKTATAKRFCDNIIKYGSKTGVPVECIIVNCRHKNTESAVLLSMVRHYDPAYSERGFSPTEMLVSLKKHIEKNKSRVIIVLDEADIMLKKSPNLIYQLSRFSEESINRSVSLSIIMISQENIFDLLDEASASTFRRSNAVRFDKYTRNELRSIVETRVEEALNNGSMNEDAIDLIADISSEWGDARMAIELLDKAARIGEESDNGTVTAEEVRAANAMTHGSAALESKLNCLDMNHKITLLSIARSIKSKAYVNIGASEKTYGVVCEEYNSQARKHTQYWTYVQDLEKLGLVTTKVETDGNNGRSTLISLPDISSKALAEKLEELM